MTHIVVIGGGIGGVPMAFEMCELLKSSEKITLVSNADYFQFVPSNPWVAVNWRQRENICIDLPPIMRKKKIEFTSAGARRVHPEKNQVELGDGSILDYDYLVIATGPELAFDEVEGLGPEANTHSVCQVDHAVEAGRAYEKFLEDPGPIVIGAAAGASCFGPALEMALIVESDLRKRKLRHKVPMTYVTPEPYVGHLGLGGVGDTKGMVESIMRERHIRWICNARIDRCEPGKLFATEHDASGTEIRQHELEHRWSMILPAFRGVPAVAGIDGLTNPRGFIIVDHHQRNPTFDNVFSVGVCIAIPPVEVTPVPTGCPKTGFMIESMVTAAAHNIRALIDGREPDHEGSWSAACLADFGDRGAAFVAVPQIPPRNINWSSEGRWVHYAKIVFEKYFLRKVRKGIGEPGYEKQMLRLAGLRRIKI
ncbi:MAG: FAD/NAD(P)-binding oxidoreductase [Gammaproteobacteria bacterium]|jgi:sulfide:quinone oxidoreductase